MRKIHRDLPGMCGLGRTARFGQHIRERHIERIGREHCGERSGFGLVAFAGIRSCEERFGVILLLTGLLLIGGGYGYWPQLEKLHCASSACRNFYLHHFGRNEAAGDKKRNIFYRRRFPHGIKGLYS
jgi:hypothetical protein